MKKINSKWAELNALSDKNTVMVKEACGRSAFDFEVKIQVFQGQGVVLALWSKRQKNGLTNTLF